jgi:RHS repeat-associated protein
VLKVILTEEGYMERENNMFNPYYYLKDHLGNNRIVMNSSGTVVQATNHYPSGTSIAEYPRRTDQGVQPYKFGGKELDRTHGLDFYDFEARAFDPTLMRFTTIDPLAEKYYSISPYAYCGNNPVNAIDPTGMDYYMITSDGRMVLALKTDDKYDRLYSPHNTENNFMKVNDQSLLPQLAGGKDFSSAETSNANDAFNVFKFAADNSSPEWNLKGYNTEGGGSGFLLSTSFDDESVSSGNGSYDPSNLVFALHSHPDGTDNLGPSGFLSKTTDSKTYEPSNLGGDLYSMIQRFNINPNTKHYIYHEGTKKLIYYNLITAVNQADQNKRGISKGVVNSGSQMRKKILGY